MPHRTRTPGHLVRQGRHRAEGLDDATPPPAFHVLRVLVDRGAPVIVTLPGDDGPGT